MNILEIIINLKYKIFDCFAGKFILTTSLVDFYYKKLLKKINEIFSQSLRL